MTTHISHPNVPVMLGLRTARLRAALTVLIVCYAVVRAFAFGDPRSSVQWVLEAVAAVGLCVALCTVVGGVLDPLPRSGALAAAGIAIGATACAWWAVPDDAGTWVQPGAPVAVFAVIVGVLALRGRAPTAWIASGVAVAVACVWSMHNGGTLIAGGQICLRVVVSLLPATMMAVLVRPMLRLTGVLEDRRGRAVEEAAAAEATAAERSDRLAKFDSEVRPILQRVAAGDVFDEQSAANARIVEADLRDEVRGRAWHSDCTRAALAGARLRGLVVRVFDDSTGDDLTDADLKIIRDGLVFALAVVASGAVTARLLPSGRDDVAVITAVTVDDTVRVVCSRTAGELTWARG